MKKYLFLFSLLLIISTTINAQTWMWTQRVTDSLMNAFSQTNVQQTRVGSSLNVETDDRENIFIAQGLLFKKTSLPSYDRYVIRIAKHDNKGKTIWAKYFDGPGTQNNGSFPIHVYDMKLDKLGNIYMVMRNFKMYDSVSIGDGNTTNCLVKINPNGKLLWKKQVGLIEDNFSAPQYCHLAMSPQATHFYAYIQHLLPGMQFLDSNYNKPPGQPRFILIKIDSAGRIMQDLKFIGVSINLRGGGLAVNKNDEVVITGSGYSDITLADTTIGITNSNQTFRKSFIALFRGSNLARKWTRIVSFVSAAPLSSDIMSAIIAANGDIGFLVQYARSGSDLVFNKQLVFGADTITWQMPNLYENPHIHITDSTGRLKYTNSLSPDSRVLVPANALATDKLNNFYITGSKAVLNAQLQERFVPIIMKMDNSANRLWMNRITGTDSVSPIYPVPAGMYDYPVMYTAIALFPQPVFGPDTLALPNCSFCSFPVLSAIGGKSNVIRGKVYRDYNSNHVQDAGEGPVDNLLVTANNGQFNAFTDRNGNYLLVADSGTHQLSIPGRPRYYGCFPASHSVVMNGYGLTVSDKNFALTLDTLIQDVSVDVTHYGAARPGFNSLVAITCRNNGTLPVAGYYTLKFDSGISFLQSDSTAIMVGPDSIRWNYATLFPGQQFVNHVRTRTDPTVAVGSIKKFAGSIYPYLTDTAKENNADTAWVTITGSYDPNDKLVYPFHDIRIDTIQAGKKILEYTIRFQNTGNDTAFNILITDTLSSKLDLTKLRFISSSHPVELQWKDPGILKCYFPNILLPDSNRNEPKSHGFVKFSIAPKTVLSAADTIYNKASIYFDYNLPVPTNRVNTQFKNNITTPVTNITRNEYQVAINPNPVVTQLYYTICCFPVRENIRLEISDVQGHQLLARSIDPLSHTLTGSINVQHLAAGVYFLNIKGRKGVTAVKFIKTQ